MTTPLYHATIGILSGLVFPIGNALFFTSVEDPRIYQVTNLQALTLTASVDEGLAAFLEATVLEPRLLALAGEVL